MQGKPRSTKLVYLLAVTNILLVGALGYLIFIKGNEDQKSVEQEQQKYPLLSKRIFSESQNDILINFTPLREEINKYVQENPGISVYFEYLPSGSSIGVNDKEEINIASLGKVPVAMAAFKEIELDTVKLDQKIKLQAEHLDKKSGELWKKGVGSELTVEEAIRLSLVESDNTANRALHQVLPEGSIERVFDSLDIPRNKEGSTPIISPKNYSSILKTLYLSAYLQRSSSNQILDYLSQSKFTEQLVAGVPDDVKVAHKFGVFESEQVHSDCGIIYATNRPYSLCVMVEGDDATASKHIALLSRMVYGFIAQSKQ